MTHVTSQALLKAGKRTAEKMSQFKR